MLFARQPIFDRSGQVVGYELLYRSEESPERAAGAGADTMLSTVLVDAVLEIGLDAAADGRQAFLNFSETHLVEGVASLLDPSAVVVEVQEDVAATSQVVVACERLRAAGYRLALDNFRLGDPRTPLLEHASLVKVDTLSHDEASLAALAESVRGRATLVATRVEDAAVRDRCQALGFELFQGYFFRKPELVQRKDLTPDVIRTLTLMNLLRDPEVAQAEVVEGFRGDPALTVKLLRMANSAAVGAREVSSIPHAIGLLGRGPLYRWVALIFAAAAGRTTGMKGELLREVLIRARFCESAAERAGLLDSGEAFLVGLFSRLEPLLGVPLSELLDQVRLAEPVERALTERAGFLAWVLELAEAHEAADWERAGNVAESAGLDELAVSDCYLDALAWMRTSMEQLAAA
ncbi:MAG TPA: EAL domain-containing protein [Longimicrobiales bacterium]|nr:EAL domain-containing protein [Longimicrobiales bacterium]